MTAKEKAKELVDRFINITPCNDNELSEDEMYKEQLHSAKQCALICVDEKQKTIDKMFNGYYTMPKEWQKEYDELEEVKEEINKL